MPFENIPDQETDIEQRIWLQTQEALQKLEVFFNRGYLPNITLEEEVREKTTLTDQLDRLVREAKNKLSPEQEAHFIDILDQYSKDKSRPVQFQIAEIIAKLSPKKL